MDWGQYDSTMQTPTMACGKINSPSSTYTNNQDRNIFEDILGNIDMFQDNTHDFNIDGYKTYLST